MFDAEIPQIFFEFVRSHVSSQFVFLILLNILLLILGALLDIFSAILIMVPLLLPVAVGYGIHPVHLGIIFIANMQIGYFHSAYWNESLYCQLPVSKTNYRALFGYVAVYVRFTIRTFADYLHTDAVFVGTLTMVVHHPR